MDQANCDYNDKSTPAHVLVESAQSVPLPNIDQDLIALSIQHIANRQALEDCRLDVDESPFWPAYAATSEAISAARPMSLAGLASKARAAKREAFVEDGEENVCNGSALEWAWDLVNDLIRLDGDVA